MTFKPIFGKDPIVPRLQWAWNRAENEVAVLKLSASGNSYRMALEAYSLD